MPRSFGSLHCRLRFVYPLFLWFALCLTAPPIGARNFPGSNDSMFPSTPAAKPFMDFDGKGFLVGGKRTFIAAGALHYSRVPRALWRDRLLRIKRAGYNTVQTYVFWSYHETREGQYDFSGDKDLDAYLKLMHSLGMYAILRIGPYVNAEWSGGGWPVWLRFKLGVIVRDDNPPFLAALDHWMDHLMPIVAANQITHGGPVILVQLENEDTRGAGTDLPNAYFVHLRDKAIALGLQVPHFFSGLNHSANPADSALDLVGRTSPWYSSEFWTGWINVYGSAPAKAARLEQSTWRVLAYGGAGYSHYTVAGGTNFDGWNCDEQGTNYDFGAPIGQTGDLRDVYYRLKRAALFGTSFSDILANSDQVDSQYADAAPSVHVTARQSPAGTIVFLDNSYGTDPVTTQVKGPDGAAYPAAGPLTVAPGEVAPIVENYSLCPGVKIEMAAARILGITRDGHVTTMVIYGPAGEPAEVHFTAPSAKVPLFVATDLLADHLILLSSGHVEMTSHFPATSLSDHSFQAGPETVRIIAVNSDLADRTWFVQANDKNALVIGPDYVGDMETRGRQIVVQTERRPSSPATPQPAFLITGSDAPRALTPTQPFRTLADAARVPALGPWFMASGSLEAQPGYNDAAWLSSPDPLPMGADSDQSEYAWYRTTIPAPKAGTFRLHLSDVGDWVSAFVNGIRTNHSAVRQRRKQPVERTLTLNLNAGNNTVALLAANYGRMKLHAYVGPIDEIDRKGVSGPVTLGGAAAQTVEINSFRWRPDAFGIADAAVMAAPELDTSGSDWRDADTSTDVFHGRVGYVWFRALLPNVAGPHRVLHISSIDDYGQVYLNGKPVASAVGIDAEQDISLDSAWQEGGKNALAVLALNTGGSGGIMGEVTLSGAPAGGPETVGQPVQGWKMRGGVRLPAETAWGVLYPNKALMPPAPRFYRTTFTYAPPGTNSPHPILRVSPLGFSRGFVWLNGHNLGRYPERSLVNGLYLPECWMQAGRNTLVFFDEDGAPPTQAALVEEQAASRDNIALTTGR